MILFKHSPALPWVVTRLEPAMSHFGLPGEAALVLVLGASINLYAAVAACAGLGLSAGQVTLLAIMLGFAHNLFVEGAVLFRLSPRAPLWIALRIAAAVGTGLLLGPWLAATWPAAAGAAGATHAGAAPGDPSLAHELLAGGARSALTLLAIVVPIVALLELLQSTGGLARLRGWLTPALRMLGLEPAAAEAALAGVFFGLVYGAGVILDRVQAEGLPPAQVDRLCLLLLLFHAIVEDTLLFVPVGGLVLPIVAVRGALAVAALLAVRAAAARAPGAGALTGRGAD